VSTYDFLVSYSVKVPVTVKQYAITCRMFRVTVGSNNNGETKRVGKEDDDEDEENEG
jgi:hypothetical protein